MDAFYHLGPSGRAEELRLSLRSLRLNAPYIDRVWIFGRPPYWLKETERLRLVPVDCTEPKYENSFKLINLAAVHPETSEELVLMNDDFFVMRRILSASHFRNNRGPLDKLTRRYAMKSDRPSAYARNMIGTAELLEELFEMPASKLYSYELHAPMLIRKDVLADACARVRKAEFHGVHIRTVAGNLARLAGEPAGRSVPDCKIYDPLKVWSLKDGPFISSAPSSWNAQSMLRAQIKRAFPRKGPDE